MTPLSQQDLELQQPQSRWDFVLEALLIVLLVSAPFAPVFLLAFGGFSPGTRVAASQEIVLGLCAALVLVLSAKHLFRRDLHFIGSWGYVPILLFFALIVFQLLPLPASFLRAVSPGTLELKTTLLKDLPTATTILASPTVTFYSLATRTDLRTILAAATVFCVVVNVYRRPSEIKRLLIAVSVIGAAVALMAAWQNLTGARPFYSDIPNAHPNSGPFTNHSHFGQFINLSIGGMLALLMVLIGEMTEGGAQLGESLRYRQDAGPKLVWFLGIAILLSAGVILLSLSRGAGIAMVVSGGATAMIWVLRRGKSHAGSVLAVVCFVALLLGLYVASSTVFDRLLTLRHVGHDNGDRVQVLRDMSAIWKQFPLLGTGLGTHQYIFPMFDHSTILAMPLHAEDEYAELLEECGAIGLGLCLIFVAIILWQYIRVIWARHRSIHLAAFGLGYGLIAVLIQSTTDFGQHTPAIACLTAVVCGLLVALARIGRPRKAAPKGYVAKRSSPWLSIPLRTSVAAVAIALFAWTLPAAHIATRSQYAWDKSMAADAAVSRRGWDQASDDDFKSVLRPATVAAQIQPADVRLQFWLNNFRWRWIIHRDSSLPPLEIPFAQRIVDELGAARASCPTFGPSLSLEGEIEEVLALPIAASHIRMGYRLDANDPNSCAALAILDEHEGKWDEAMSAARRALALDGSLQDGLLASFLRLNHPEAAYALVSGDRDGLARLAYRLHTDPTQSKLEDRCRDEATALLLADAARPDASGGLVEAAGQYYAQTGDDKKAVEYFARAVSRSDLVDWRYNLAVALKKTGQLDAAAREARTCLALRPRMKEAEALLDSMNARQLGD